MQRCNAKSGLGFPKDGTVVFDSGRNNCGNFHIPAAIQSRLPEPAASKRAHVRRWKPSIADRLEDVATSLLDVAYAVEAIAEQQLSGLGNES